MISRRRHIIIVHVLNFALVTATYTYTCVNTLLFFFSLYFRCLPPRSESYNISKTWRRGTYWNYYRYTVHAHTGFYGYRVHLQYWSYVHRVCMGPGKLWHFWGLEILVKRLQICVTQVKIWSVWQTVRRITGNIALLGVKGLMWSLESWKNVFEFWKSPRK